MDSVGKVRLRNLDLAEKIFKHADQNGLSHDNNGFVSVVRGGGKFDFTIAPKSNRDLDETNLIIGRVLSGMDVVEKINNVPVSREDALGTKGVFSKAGKSFDGTFPTRFFFK